MSSDDEDALAIFQEPEGFRQPEKPFTYQHHLLANGDRLELRLVGHNPLWGHHLWQAARIISHFLESNHTHYLRHKTVLELGAGAALPSLVAARHGASVVVATDYPDPELISNIQYNIAHCAAEREVHALGFLWGADPAPLKSLLPHADGFDTLILADLLFNHSCHGALLRTIRDTLKRAPDSSALVFFTPYRPWLFDKDMAFFDLVRDDPELQVEKLGEWKMDQVMFQEDRGDEELRRTVFGFAVKWVM